MTRQGSLAMFVPRTWIDIDLDRLTDNYRSACSLTQARVTAVVKSNAYGHGAVQVARTLQKAGCASFAVSCAREALELRAAGIGGEILVMGLCEPILLPACIGSDVTLTVACTEDMEAMEQAALPMRKTAAAHIKLDTGFHRLGFACTRENAEKIASAAARTPHLRLEGLYSHLGLITPERDAMQHDALLRMQADLADFGVQPADIHLCDSIGLVRYPAFHHSRVRVGAILYGVRPFRSEDMPFQCRETLAFRTTVAQVRDVPAGEVIGYDEQGITDHPMRIATLCAGYGDGYPRCLSGGRGKVLIRGRRAPVVGLVCMDQMMADVSAIPDCAPGDTATLLGDGIPYAEYAAWAGTNRNECITILSRRPQRIYRRSGYEPVILDSLIG